MKLSIVLKHKHLSELPGYEDLKDYIIFADGSLYSLITHRFLDGNISRCYRRVCMNNRCFFFVHRLLALAFIPNPNNHPCVDHIDRNRLNNDLSNLRWCSIAQNSQNKSKQSNNTSGQDCIRRHVKRSGIYVNHYWKIEVTCGDEVLSKCIPRGEHDTVIPDSVKLIRDKFKKELHGSFSNII